MSIASGPVIQICWVTDDIEATERLLSEQFGVGGVDADPRRPVRAGHDHAARASRSTARCTSRSGTPATSSSS